MKQHYTKIDGINTWVDSLGEAHICAWCAMRDNGTTDRKRLDRATEEFYKIYGHRSHGLCYECDKKFFKN